MKNKLCNTPRHAGAYLLIMVLLASSITHSDIDAFISPKKQIQQGILPEKILCNEGLELIFKSTDGSPACIKPSSLKPLVNREWAKLLELKTDKEVYQKGESMKIVLKNISSVPLQFRHLNYGIDVYDDTEWLCCMSQEGIVTLTSGGEFDMFWNQIDQDDAVFVQPGKYQIIVNCCVETGNGLQDMEYIETKSILIE